MGKKWMWGAAAALGGLAVVSNIMLVSNSNIMSGKTGKSIMNIGASDLDFIPKTLEEYEAKYNSLLDSLSLCFLCGPLYR